MPAPKSLIVTTAETASLGDVAVELQALGFEVDNVLEFAGCITGTCATELDALRRVPGVLSVEEDGEQFAI